MPVGDEALAVRRALAVLGGPASLADVQPLVGLLLVEEERVKRLAPGEMAVTSLT